MCVRLFIFERKTQSNEKYPARKQYETCGVPWCVKYTDIISNISDCVHCDIYLHAYIEKPKNSGKKKINEYCSSAMYLILSMVSNEKIHTSLIFHFDIPLFL